MFRNFTQRFTLLTVTCYLLTVNCAIAQSAIAPEDRLLLAEGLLGRGMYALAAEEYAALAAQENATPDILFRLAECYHRLDKWPEADAAYARLVQKFPQSVEAVRAQLQRAQKTPDRAVELLAPYREWKGDPALESAILLSLAAAFERAQKPADAIAAYDDLIRRFPNDKTASLARLNAGLSMLADANAETRKRGTQYLMDVIHKKAEPQWAAEALYALAQHEYTAKNYTDSAGYFGLLAAQHPDSPRAKSSWLQAVWANYLAGQRDAALALLDAHPVVDPKSADQQSWLYLRANLLRLKNDPAARAAYEKLLADFPNPDPRILEARFEYASLLFARKDFKTLQDFFQRNHDFAAHAEEVLWMKIEASFSIGDFDPIISLCETLDKSFPNSTFLAAALNRAAFALEQKGEHAAAAQTYARLAQNYADNPAANNAWLCAGKAWSQAGDNVQAIDAYQKAIAKNPQASDSDTPALYLASLAAKIEKDAVAETAASHIIDLPQSKHRAYALLLRAILRQRASNPKGMEDDLRACLATGANDVDLVTTHNEARRLLGSLLHEQQRFSEAAECFQFLVAETPPLPPALLHWLAQFQLDANQPAFAEATARALLTEPLDATVQQEAHLLLGRALHAQNKNPDAIASIQSALAIDVNTAAAASGALLLGQLQLDAKDLPAADAAFQDAAKRASTPELLTLRADAYLGLAQTARAAGKDDDALRYNLAVALLFDDPVRVPVALDQTITLLQKLNRPAEARQQLQELLTRYPDSPQAKQRK